MNLRRVTNSLLTRMFIFGIVVVLFGAATRYVVLTRLLREDLTQTVSTQQLALAEALANDIDYKIAERRDFLNRLASTLPPELLERPALLRPWLAERHRLQPLFSLGLIVADSNGKILADYPELPGRRGRSLADDPDFHIALDGQSHIGRPLLGPVSKVPTLPMSAPLKDRAGKVRAVLLGVTAIAAPGFLDRLQQGRLGESGGYLLISPRDKLFVAASDPRMVLKPTPPPGVNLLHDRAMNGFRGSAVTVNAFGVEELSSMVSVPSAGWFVVARMPTSEAFATVGRIKSLIIRHTFTAILGMLVFTGLIITWLLRPLYRTAEQAERMTSGEAPLTPLAVTRNDEVGHLTMAFNRLLAKLTSSQAELERMAHHDTLTGLPNRSLLADRMQQALARAQRNGTRIAVLFLDLDGFKPINDSLGHKAGDQALQEVTRRLSAVLRQSDTLARVGGDEFVLLATDLEAGCEDGIRTLADKCIDAVAQPLPLQRETYILGVSIGIALCDGACSADRLLLAADKAMYEAKEKGRGCYVMAPDCQSRPHSAEA
jgi:diguanylate cyclase (GGDEF)-like protein